MKADLIWEVFDVGGTLADVTLGAVVWALTVVPE